MDEVEWTERHERMAQRLPSANADTDPELLATALAHLRAGRIDGLAVARAEADARATAFRLNAQTFDYRERLKAKCIDDYFAKKKLGDAFKPVPWPSPSHFMSWKLFELACDVFAPALSRIAGRSFSLGGVTYSSAHAAACACFDDMSDAAEELLSRVRPACDYEFEKMEAESVGMNGASVHPIDMMVARHAYAGEAEDRGAVDSSVVKFGPYRMLVENGQVLIDAPPRAVRTHWLAIRGSLQDLLRDVLKKKTPGTRFSAKEFAGGGHESTARKKLDELCKLGVLCKARGQRSPYCWTEESKPEGVPDLRPS